MAKAKTCGDFGGKNGHGRPCGRAAGHGTGQPGTGTCRSHSAESQALRADQKNEIIEQIREGHHSLRAIAKLHGIGARYLFRLRERDAEFDEQVRIAMAAADEFRVSMVEDTLYRRLIAGKASPAEVIFYLVNRASHRWQHVYKIEHTARGGEALIPLATVRSALKDADGNGNSHKAKNRLSR